MNDFTQKKGNASRQSEEPIIQDFILNSYAPLKVPCGLVCRATISDWQKIIESIKHDFPNVLLVIQITSTEKLWLIENSEFEKLKREAGVHQ